MMEKITSAGKPSRPTLRRASLDASLGSEEEEEEEEEEEVMVVVDGAGCS
jgi:hypothetical protein